jgi:hypothetical protein
MPDTAILNCVALDFTSPFDELSELRSFLSTQEIAELTGLRRETVSRARPDSRFQRRTEKALHDLYVVATRMRAAVGGDRGRLGPILRRPQSVFGDRSIADLLRAGEVDLVLEHLAAASGPVDRTDPKPNVAAPRRPTPNVPPDDRGRSGDDAVEAFLAADPEVAAVLPEVEAKLRDYFAPVTRLERGISVEYDGDGDDALYLWAHNDLPFDENEKRFMAFLDGEREFLRPVRSRLNIGFL